MKVWIVCPKCLDSWEGIPGEYCHCETRSVVAPLMMQPKYQENWEEICLDGADVEEVEKFKSKYFNCSVYINCDGEMHYAVDKDDEFLYAVECNC